LPARNNGLRDLQKRLSAIPKAARRAASDALDKSAAELVSVQKRFAPVDDGTLRDSIHAEATGELTRTVRAGGEATTRRTGKYEYDYSLGVEFGNLNHPAQSFFWPAYRLLRSRIRRRIRRAIGKGIKEAYNGK